MARFWRRRRGRQTKHGRHGGDFGGAKTIVLGGEWGLMAAVAKFGESAATVPLTWMLPIRGRRGGRSAATGGIEKSFRLTGVIGPRGLWQHNDIFWLRACTSVKKHGHHMILICCNTNLGSLYTMVHSDLHGNAVLVVLLVLLERVS